MAKETGQDFSNVTQGSLAEAIKMRRCPGYCLPKDGGRRARVRGQGLKFGMIAAYKSMKEDSKAAKATIAIRRAGEGGGRGQGGREVEREEARGS